MNEAVVLAINPCFAELIYEGKKTVEIRTYPIKSWNLPVLLYETLPVSRVTGMITISEGPFMVLRGDVEALSRACVSVDDSYIRTVRQLIGYRIGRYKKLEEPVPLSDLGIGGMVRSYRYVEHLPDSIRTMMEDEEAWTARGLSSSSLSSWA